MTVCSYTAPPRSNEMLPTAWCVAERFVFSPYERPTDSRHRWSSPVPSSSCDTSLVPGAQTQVQVSDAWCCTSYLARDPPAGLAASSMHALRWLCAGLSQLRYQSASLCCRNHSTCPKFCDLCRHNPNKRCEAEGDLAVKQLENTKLETYCGAPIVATLHCFETLQGEQPDGAAGFEKGEAQQFYVEVSLVLQNLLTVSTI